MGKIILVTGGSRSGKSNYAENLVRSMEKEVIYIATSIPFDDEMKDRVKKHKERRPSSWHTYEGYKDLKMVFQQDGTSNKNILLDCITIMVTNLIFEFGGFKVEDLNNEQLDTVEKKVLAEVEDFIDAVCKNSSNAVLVTNEVGYGIVPENKLGRIFRDIAGRVNQYVASRAEEVYLVVCGIPVKIK